MQTQSGTAPAETSAREIFALSDEQILDIAPEGDVSAPVGQPFLAVQERASEAAVQPEGQSRAPENARAEAASPQDRHSAKTAQPEMAVPQEPPPWLAAQMNDPWTGSDAKEFWHGMQQAKSEAQAYRAAIATPEDARALKELYPGGVTEARAAADRACMLDEVDRAYFGGAGNSPEQRSASRAQLAQQLLREDPAAFREMLVAGLQALQQAEQGTAQSGEAISALPRLAKAVAPREDLNVAPPFRAVSSVDPTHETSRPATNPDVATVQHESRATDHDPRLTDYAAFERAANEDLERSVGSAIDRSLAQALPVAQPLLAEQRTGLASPKTAQAGVPALHERLATGIRAEVEKALQGDRQLSEQVAQILASRRFDDDSRAQVVRLIADRAQQLVPGAAKRVLNEWTQTTLVAHRTRTQRNDAAVDLAPASNGQSSDRSGLPKEQARESAAASRAGATHSPRRVDYRKLSDEQILNL